MKENAFIKVSLLDEVGYPLYELEILEEKNDEKNEEDEAVDEDISEEPED